MLATRPAHPETRRLIRGLWLGSFLTLAVACDAAPQRNGRPLVAVSVPPLAYFVDRLAGDLVDVEIMVPPGASPHVWEPNLEQMRAANTADLYVEVGHPHFSFEKTWLRRLIEANDDVRIIDCASQTENLEEDPHIWTSPQTVRKFVPAIAAALSDLLPAAAAEVDVKRRQLLAEIDALDADVRRILEGTQGKRFYVFHPAWGYLARDYGLVQVSIEHGSKEPSAAELADLIRQAQSEGVNVIFVQPQFSERSARVVAAEVGAELVNLDPLALDWPAAIREAAGEIAAAVRSDR